MQVTIGFSDKDIEKLDEILDGFGTDIEWAVGFLAAVVSGPDHVPTSVWLPAVQDDEPFANDADAKIGVELLMRLHEHVRTGLETGAERLCPEPDDVDEIASFCGGYFEGSRLHPSWAGDAVGSIPVMSFAALAGETELGKGELATGADGKPLVDLDAWKRKQRESLAHNVEQLHVHWAEKRNAMRVATRPAPARSTKVGRNDACPCGSGKKHKKCCLV